jgi:hypothetical protein
VGFKNDLSTTKPRSKLMEYEGYHLVSLFKEAAENACTQLFIIAFHKNKKENSKMKDEIELNFC